jgi:hypothetical protein
MMICEYRGLDVEMELADECDSIGVLGLAQTQGLNRVPMGTPRLRLE